MAARRSAQERYALRKTMSFSPEHTLRKIRCWLWLFVLGLLLSGITAFPLVSELQILDGLISADTRVGEKFPALANWISFVHSGLVETSNK